MTMSDEEFLKALDVPFTFDMLRDSEWQPSREDYRHMRDGLKAALNRERAEAGRLREAFADLLEAAEDMRAYVPDYFAQKWKHDDALGAARAVPAPSEANPDRP